MTTKILRDVQTQHGRILATKRVWIASNGHEVIVETDACINSRSTYGDRLYAYSRVIYTCECGKMFQKMGAARKSELKNHDLWPTTKEAK